MGNLDLNKKKQDEQIKVNIEALWNTQAKLHIKESSKQVRLCFSVLTGWRTFLKKQIPRPQWTILFHLRDKELSLGWATVPKRFKYPLNIWGGIRRGWGRREGEQRGKTDTETETVAFEWLCPHRVARKDGSRWNCLKRFWKCYERLWRRASMEEMSNLRFHSMPHLPFPSRADKM